MKEVVNHKLLSAAIYEFSEEKYPIQTAKNGVRYVDVPATGFYSGRHKGFVYSGMESGPNHHIKQLETSFAKPVGELHGRIPVMVNHSGSNWDKIGHMRSVTTVGNVSMPVLRVVGEEGIKGLREGKFWTLSAGIDHTYDPKASFSKDGFVGQCPECGADIGEDDDGICPECGCNANEMSRQHDAGDEAMCESEEASENLAAESDADEEMSAGGSPGRTTFSKGFREKFEADTSKIRVAYDHMAFTHQPYLKDCITHDRSKTNMSKPITPVPAPTVTAPAAPTVEQFAELNRKVAEYEAALEASQEAAKTAQADAEAKANRKLDDWKRLESYQRDYKITPHEKPLWEAVFELSPPELGKAIHAALNSRLPQVETEIKNVQRAIPPEQLAAELAMQRFQASQGGPAAAGGMDAEVARLLSFSRLGDPSIRAAGGGQ